MQALQEFWRHFKLLPSAWLLIVQLLMLLVVPMINHEFTGNAVGWIFATVALLLVAKIIHTTAAYNVVGLVLVIPALILSVLVALGYNQPHILIAANLCEAAAYICAAYGLIRYMFADRYLTRDELFAAASVFTLMVWAFAFIYSACQLWQPDSFTVAEKSRVWISMIFLSFSVQSGTGLSDIYPQTDVARVLVALQMFCGVMYLALIVSRLIAMQYIKHKPKA